MQLVFSGGGVRAVAYAGAVEVLAGAIDLETVHRVAGASAGSLAAVLVALGVPPPHITKWLIEAPYASFADGSWGAPGEVGRLMRHYGLHPGDTLGAFVRERVAAATALLGSERPDLTFAELDALAIDGTCASLFVIATNLSRQSAAILCAETAPDLPVWKAVRMSMSIPGFFEPVSWSGELWVDGGVSWNYPIDLFEETGREVPGKPTPGGPTLGMCLGTREAMIEGATSPVSIDGLEAYFHALVSFALRESTRVHVTQQDLERTVFVPDEGVTTLDLTVSRERLEALVEGGKGAMRQALDQGIVSRLVAVP